MRYRQVHEGEWVKPVMKKYHMQCCNCGIVHLIDFKVIKWGRGHKVLLRAFLKTKTKKGKKHANRPDKSQ